jgi:hypothetical protein
MAPVQGEHFEDDRTISVARARFSGLAIRGTRTRGTKTPRRTIPARRFASFGVCELFSA